MRLIGLLIAIVLGVGTFLLATKFTKKDEGPKTKIVEVVKEVPQEVPTVDVFVARAGIPVGTTLDSSSFDCQPWPSHLILDSFIVSDGKSCEGKDLIGLVTRSAFQAREPIIRSKLSNPSDPGFLAAGLPEGMRAVTISVDLLSSVAGFIFPGDRVDVLINHRVDLGPENPEDPNSRPLIKEIMEVLLPDIKIIAVDQMASIQGQGARVPASVTVEVSKQDAQKLKLGEARGRLTLALRPLAPKGEEGPDGKPAEQEEEDLARPTGVNDLTRILPPEYFPVLYSGDGDYTIAEMGKNASAVPPEVKARMGMISNQSDAPAKKDDTADVRIVRGVAFEDVEVKRP